MEIKSRSLKKGTIALKSSNIDIKTKEIPPHSNSLLGFKKFAKNKDYSISKNQPNNYNFGNINVCLS